MPRSLISCLVAWVALAVSNLVKEKNSLAEAILTQAADPTPVKVGAARINTLIYQEAFDKAFLR